MREITVFVLSKPPRGASSRSTVESRLSTVELSSTWKCRWEHGRPASPARWSDRRGQCTLCYPCIGARVAGIGSCRHLDIDRLAMVDCPRRATALTDPQSTQANLCAMPTAIISPWGQSRLQTLLRRQSHPQQSPALSRPRLLTLTLRLCISLAPNCPDAAANLDMPAQLLSLP